MIQRTKETDGVKRKKVAFVNTDLLRFMSRESRKELFAKLNEHNLKIYQSSSAYELLKFTSKLCVIRYGHIPDIVSRKITLRGGVILSGDL